MSVQTRFGPVAAAAGTDALTFRGIPFARSPSGERRFLPPLAPDPWSAVRHAADFGPASPQGPDLIREGLFGQPALVGNEDGCLTLNVFTPGTGGRRPVLVWIHGGGFVTGSGTDPMFDGARLAKRRDLVVVTVNYRLGSLGFLYLGEVLGPDYAHSGLNGILDQLAALRWVRENIAAFGGDPGNVTICGQSAGAVSVATLMAMPSAKGLFHRAVVQSGSAEMVRSRDSAAVVTRRYLDILGLKPNQAKALLDAPVDELMGAQPALARRLAAENDPVPVAFAPVIDGTLLPGVPLEAIRNGSAAGIPLLLGTMSNEGGLFAYEAGFPDEPDGLAARAQSLFVAPTEALAEAQARHSGNVYLYDFRWGSPVHDGRLGACHSLDLPFLFDCLDLPGIESFVGPAPPQALADRVGAAWSAFARTGEPGLGWRRFTNRERAKMTIDATASAQNAAAAVTPAANAAGVEMHGIVNLRDLGGFRTIDGLTTSHGVFFRSGLLRTPIIGDPRLGGRALSAIYDLRTPSEAREEPDLVPEGAVYHLFNVYGNEHLVEVPEDPAEGRQIMMDIYRKYIIGPSEQAAYGAMFRAMAVTEGPQLFHCASGKDRTGWAAAVLLLALGVATDAVMEDFLESNAQVVDSPAAKHIFADWSPQQRRAMEPFVRVSADYLYASLAEIDRVFGDVNSYFLNGLQVPEATLAILRRRLLA